MSDLPSSWSAAADGYESAFVDPFRRPDGHPLLDALAAIDGASSLTVADLGCGVGPLLPHLSARFATVHAIDFAAGMIDRAKHTNGNLANVTFHQRDLTDLSPLHGKCDVAVMVNSLVMPEVSVIETVLRQVRKSLRPGGVFFGILPAMDSVHYETMLLLDRARSRGMPEDKARLNAAKHAEHHLFDFAFGGFCWRGLDQHFWQPFEIAHRLRRAGFAAVRKKKLRLDRSEFACAADLKRYPPPWDWFFSCRRREKAL